MEVKILNITLDTAKKWYNSNNESLKVLALQLYNKEELIEFPNSWEQFCSKVKFKENECYISASSDIYYRHDLVFRRIEKDKNMIPSKEYAKGILALIQLIQLRDCYRQDWKPDWKNFAETKYSIIVICNNIETIISISDNKFLSFQSAEIRDKFLNNFKDLIEQAKEYI